MRNMISGMLTNNGYGRMKVEIDGGVVKQSECQVCDGKGETEEDCNCCNLISMQPCEACNGTGIEKSGS